MADYSDMPLVETGESSTPTYDVSTDKMLDPSSEGGKREPSVMETVEAVVAKQKADRDPVQRHIQNLEKNGRTLGGLLDEVAEYDNVAERDPVDAVRMLAERRGLNPNKLGEHLALGTSPTGLAGAAAAQATQQAVADFEAKYNDNMTRNLRPDAIKILQKNDKRLAGHRTQAECLERAFALAWHDKYGEKVNGPSKVLDDRDASMKANTEAIKKQLSTKFAR
jgi:hypothetical protein